MRSRPVVSVVLAMVFTSVLTSDVLACAVCFGATANRSAAVGLGLAIIALLGVLLAVLFGIVGFFVRLQKRSKALAA